jgi:lipoprotein-releasing system ATP-binding protein
MKIEAANLTMRFHDGSREIEVFRNLSLSVPSGSSAAIVGSSGIGKTTLLYLLGGLERPSSGTINLGKTSITDAWEKGHDLAGFRGKNVGFVFQFHFLLPEFDAVENVAMPLLIRGDAPAQARETAIGLLRRVGLGDRLTHRPGMLSGGEQQRVAIARAIAPRPGIVLADEPTGNLDQSTGGGVIDLLCDLQKETGTTLIVVTHSPEIATRMDRVLEMTASDLKESNEIRPKGEH